MEENRITGDYQRAKVGSVADYSHRIELRLTVKRSTLTERPDWQIIASMSEQQAVGLYNALGEEIQKRFLKYNAAERERTGRYHY